MLFPNQKNTGEISFLLSAASAESGAGVSNCL